MSDLRESAQIRELVSDYYKQLLSFDEYRAQRKIIFDIIDKDINGVEELHEVFEENKKMKDATLINKAMSFFKKDDSDDEIQS